MLQQGRLARGLSHRELAAELGLTQRWASEMEAGKPGKLTERLFAMLDATGVRLYAEQEVGRLMGADWRRFDVETSGNAIERFRLGSPLLSISEPGAVWQPLPGDRRVVKRAASALQASSVSQRLRDRLAEHSRALL